MDERKLFEESIKQDPEDLTKHFVFGDWLEEHGFMEEAEWHRSWTKERVESEKWLRTLASRCGQTCVENYGGAWVYMPDDLRLSDDYDAQDKWTKEHESEYPEKWRDITFEDVIQAGYATIQDGYAGFEQTGDETARDLFNKNLTVEYWRHWSIYTGKEPIQPNEDELDEYRFPSPFGCSC